MITTENDFTFIRRILLDKPTIPEYQLAERIAKSINTTGSEQEVDNPLVKARLNKRSKFDTNTIIHYTYEKRLQSNKKDMHQLWNQLFQQTPVMNTRLIIGNRNNPNLTRELVHRRPQESQRPVNIKN
jgi:hypothetical protein